MIAISKWAVPVGVIFALSACGGAGAPFGAPAIGQPDSATSAQMAPACAAVRAGLARCGTLVRPATGSVTGYGPADLQAAYALPSTTQGTGQIVAIVDAFDNPNAADDLAGYRANFGLPAATFAKYNQRGKQSGYPTADVGWGTEIDTDIELVSATCPLCTIYLVEAKSNTWRDLDLAELEAVKLGATIVSSGFSGTGADEHAFSRKGITYLASSGNPGIEPASFPEVVAVGGTTLTPAQNPRGWKEAPWGGSGGCTTFPKPSWQHDDACGFRMMNDVSAVADPSTGVAAYDTYGEQGWIEIGGTSVPTPIVAGVFGLAGNATKQNGGRTFWTTAHHKFLNTIVGVKGHYSATTGWGTPIGTGAF
ncbi:MAG TPA: hypothetical protein VGF86_11135 [Candidatus Tumulicola sp.]